MCVQDSYVYQKGVLFCLIRESYVIIIIIIIIIVVVVVVVVVVVKGSSLLGCYCMLMSK
jgi:hypothetical protein